MIDNAFEFAHCVFQSLSGGESAAVAVVISRHGSGPREPGAKLVLNSAGEIWGTVGGGDLEFQVLHRAREVLQTGRPERMAFDLRNEDAANAGMMCGGRVEVLVDCLRPDDHHVSRVIQRVQSALAARQPCVLVIAVSGQGLSARSTWDLIVNGQSLTGFPYPDTVMAKWAAPPTGNTLPEFQDCNGGSFYIEWIRPPEAVFIFGAGHVGAELASLCRRAGFWTVVLDDRPEFANRDRLPDAHDIQILDRFADSFSALAIDPRSFIVIVTRGHLHDLEVLEQALRTDAGYVGMIGSIRKRSSIYAQLERTGFSAQELNGVHCPIGLSIQAETPAEIAISIAAELVAVRRGALPSRRLT